MSVPVSHARHRETPAVLAWRSSALSSVLLVLGGILLVVAVLLIWAKVTLFDSGGFADAASRSADDPAVQDRLAVALSDRIVARNPELDRARPLIQGAAEGFLASDRFQEIFRAAADRMHQRVFDENANEFVLDLTAALQEIVARIQSVAPELAARISPDLGSAFVEVTESKTRARIIRLGEQISFLAFVVPFISVVCFGASLWFARDRRGAAFRLGIALAIVAAITVLALVVGHWLLMDRFVKGENEDAATAIWWAWLESLRDTMRLIGVLGIALAVGAWWVARKGWPWQKSLPKPNPA